MSDLIDHLKREAGRNQRLAKSADTSKRRRTHAQRAKHLQKAVAEIEQLHKKLNAALLNCATPKDCIGWMQDQETGSQFQCGRCVNLRALMTGDSDNDR